MFRRGLKNVTTTSDSAMPPLPPSPTPSKVINCSSCNTVQRPGVSFFTIASRGPATSKALNKAPSSALILCPDCFKCAKCKKKFNGGEPCQTHSDGEFTFARLQVLHLVTHAHARKC